MTLKTEPHLKARRITVVGVASALVGVSAIGALSLFLGVSCATDTARRNDNDGLQSGTGGAEALDGLGGSGGSPSDSAPDETDGGSRTDAARLCKPASVRACEGGYYQQCSCDGKEWSACRNPLEQGAALCDGGDEFGCNCAEGNPGPCKPGETRRCSGSAFQQCSCDGSRWMRCEVQFMFDCDGGAAP
jgi:hypothetical protein